MLRVLVCMVFVFIGFDLFVVFVLMGCYNIRAFPLFVWGVVCGCVTYGLYSFVFVVWCTFILVCFEFARVCFAFGMRVEFGILMVVCSVGLVVILFCICLLDVLCLWVCAVVCGLVGMCGCLGCG